MKEIAAIPTLYRGTQFRSRLEARWACMFDLLEWKWEYEPIDLNGYIPDFVLAFPRPMIVEVKPYIEPVSEWFWDSITQRSQHESGETLDKIHASGWRGEGLLVGARMLEHPHAMGYDPTSRESINPGVLFSAFDNTKNEYESAMYAEPFGFKDCCGGPVDVVGSFHCRKCGDHDSGPTLRSAERIKTMWRMAGNRTQWRAPR